ncbi:hypothetical protein H9X57_14835 [Flavobacterium piscinae]|nr:hypothetical protein [Flavobacterium piscinae]MBC8884171.1 hypothetical protein [Flavobacterium piscinae]
MRKSITLYFLFILSFSFGQHFDEQWKEVYKHELEGKIQSAQKEVQEIYKKAKKKKDEVQIVKCIFYLSKFEQVFDEKAQSTIISNLRNEIKDAKPVSKALLNYIYATILQDYYERYSYTIDERTALANQKSTDFLSWTSIDFTSEIDEKMNACLQDEKLLRATPLESVKEIFEISPSTDAKNYNLYDFLVEKSIEYYKPKIKS